MSEAVILILCIIIAFFLFVSFVFNCALGLLLWRSAQTNLTLQQQEAEYKDFLVTVYGVLLDDVAVIKTEFAQRYMTANIPEVAEFSRKLTKLQNHLVAVGDELRRFGLLEEERNENK